MITYTPEEADVVAAFRLAAQPRPRRVLLSLGWMLGLAAVLLATGTGPLSSPVVAAGVVLCFAVPWLERWVIRWRGPRWARRHFEQQSAMRGPWQVSWSEDGLTMTTTRGQAVHPWTDYRWRREDAHAILLYLTDAQYQFIPRRVLTREAMAALRPLLDRVPPDRLAPAWFR